MPFGGIPNISPQAQYTTKKNKYHRAAICLSAFGIG
jgi:hypothetical protein